MAIYTADELQTEIAQAKLDLASARKMLSHETDTGGSRIQVQRSKVKELQDHLVWLNDELSKVTGSSAAVGRTFAKQGGRG